MLINLTNHPTITWGEMQISVAQKRYGEIVDMPFPNISPQWSSKQVEQLAIEYFERIQTLLPKPQTNDAVHLMGEQVFCFKLLCMLSNAGYVVVASTTQRITKVLPNGNIEKGFAFIRFREY